MLQKELINRYVPLYLSLPLTPAKTAAQHLKALVLQGPRWLASPNVAANPATGTFDPKASPT